MKKRLAHIISHSHWDREWYMPFEKHRMRLVELINDLLELFENDSSFESFHMDGQTIVLDDYLEIFPQNREKVERYIRQGKLFIGPWYILQDEFLTSGEANIRNLLVGIKEATRYGKVCKIGYLPDAFGNVGQMPQLLKQAGMKAIIFGRGVKPVGVNNQVKQWGEYDSPFSEMIWQSPDGSSLLGVLFANWYNNGVEIPIEKTKAEMYWKKKLEDTERFASTQHYLFMNGCDHQPVQKDLSQALEVAEALFPQVDFIHSNFEHYVDQVQCSVDQSLLVIQGELTSQDTDGWTTLVNTTSSRVYLKQKNQRNQVLLEKIAEPLSVMATCLGGRYPKEFLEYGWKLLMQNHPHDSICGCSVDEVHREMSMRFDKSIQVAEELVANSLNYLSNLVDTSVLQKSSEKIYPFLIFNTTGWIRDGVVSVDLDLVREYDLGLTEGYDRMREIKLGNYRLVDDAGKKVPCKIEDLGVRFGYDLPRDKFRQPYMARTVKVTFEATRVPEVGYKTFVLMDGEGNREGQESLMKAVNTMENKYMKVEINWDGTLTIMEKESGYTYHEICYYEDVGDIGNEYIFFQPVDDKPIITKGIPADIALMEDEAFRATYKIIHTIAIPSSADQQLRKGQESMIQCNKRRAQRSKEMIELTIFTYVTLEKNSRAVKVKTVFDNQAMDHRLRVIIPTGLMGNSHMADSVFEVVQRQNRPSVVWENPSNCHQQQCFVSISDEEKGMTIANFGLHEYEILPDDKNAIALTLLRSVGEMGDWGVFPTTEAQCLGKSEVEFEIIPHKGDLFESGAFIEAYQFQVEMPVIQTAIRGGELPLINSFLKWDGTTLALTAIKMNEENGDRIYRWVNLSEAPCTLTLFSVDGKVVYRSNVIEECVEELTCESNGSYCVEVNPFEIITLGVR